MAHDIIEDLLGGNSMLGVVNQYASPCRCLCHQPGWKGNKAGECPNCRCAQCPTCENYFDILAIDLHALCAHPENTTVSVKGRASNNTPSEDIFQNFAFLAALQAAFD